MSYQPPFTITSKMLSLVSDIVEIITDIKHIETNLKTPKLRKKKSCKKYYGNLANRGQYVQRRKSDECYQWHNRFRDDERDRRGARGDKSV